MTNCPACGFAFRPSAAFCGECGARLPVETTPATERPDFITLPPGVVPVASTNTGPAPSMSTRSAAVPPSPSASPAVPPIPSVAPAVQLPPQPAVAQLIQPLVPEPVITPAIAETVAPADVDATRVAAPRRVQAWSLLLPDGSSHPVTTSAIVGRAPDAAAHGAAVSISVGADQKSVSKSHAFLEVTPEGLSVRDLGSVNGVVVAHADGRESEATAAVSVDLADGDELELGEIVVVVRRG